MLVKWLINALVAFANYYSIRRLSKTIHMQ